MTGAVVVTTPSDVSLEDARKAINMFEQVRVPVLGLVENMSYLLIPGTNEKVDVFGSGGGLKTAEQMNVPFLGELALLPDVRIGGDTGRPITVYGEKDERAAPFYALARRITQRIDEVSAVKGPTMTIAD